MTDQNAAAATCTDAPIKQIFDVAIDPWYPYLVILRDMKEQIPQAIMPLDLWNRLRYHSFSTELGTAHVTLNRAIDCGQLTARDTQHGIILVDENRFRGHVSPSDELALAATVAATSLEHDATGISAAERQLWLFRHVVADYMLAHPQQHLTCCAGGGALTVADVIAWSKARIDAAKQQQRTPAQRFILRADTEDT